MVSVNPTAKTALATLQVLRPKPEETGPIRQEPSLISDSLTRVRTGAGVSDALMKINELVSGKKVAGGESTVKETSYIRCRFTTKDGTVVDFGSVPWDNKDRLSEGEGIKVSDLPAEFVKNHPFVGTADRVVAQVPPKVSDEVFRAGVIAIMKEGSTGQNKGFLAALANGTLKVQRTTDVPGLGGGAGDFDLYDKQGRLFGSIGASMPYNEEFLAAQKAAGLHTSTGSLFGINYYVTWPEKAK